MFSEDERRIFPYHDGAVQRYGDPVRMHRKLTVALEGDVNRWLVDASSGDLHLVDQAKDRLVAAVRSAFEMAPFDPDSGRGAVEADCWAALNSFLEWSEKNARRAGS